mgnify:CR=1 FL=1
MFIRILVINLKEIRWIGFLYSSSKILFPFPISKSYILYREPINNPLIGNKKINHLFSILKEVTQSNETKKKAEANPDKIPTKRQVITHFEK